MKVIGINSLQNGSPAMIMRGISEVLETKPRNKCLCFYGNWKNSQPKYQNSFRFGYRLENYVNAVFSKYTGYHNVLSIFGTLSLIRKIKRNKPDIIHLHNIHLWVINVPLLFRYIKKHKIKVVWTLHDCWAFTGQCPHFTLAKCNKWKTGCHNCTQIYVYPSSRVDRTKKMWQLKKNWFTQIKNMTLVTPSQWLADLAKQSYLKDFPIVVINNGIDLNVFKPTPSKFRSKYSLENKYIILGVAFGWGNKKGLDVFIELAKKLDNRFQIVLVGTNDKTDEQLPSNIISIHRTNDQKELAEIYTASDLFVNPTREDNYPTVNMESIACGTPVLTFKTGGSPEILDEKSGYVVDVDDIGEMEKQIIRICTDKAFSEKDCLRRAKAFDKNVLFKEYIKLYKLLTGDC